MKRITVLLLGIVFSFVSIAATVDTVIIYSNSMHKPIKCVVIKPDSYHNKKNHFPVVYLLHGFGGYFSDWIIKVPQLKKLADDNKILIVCPDGGFSSWYFDSPVDTTYKYETYVSSEVIKFIDKNFKTIADKNHRAITGLSMGGHGALFLALRHQDIFGAAGTMSGGVDLNESKNRFQIIKRIGDTISNAKNWHDLTVINLIENYTNTTLKILIDCGIKDIFINGNRQLHQKMLQLKIPHEYIERPGEHNWDYWGNAIAYHLFYFQQFFSKQ